MENEETICQQIIVPHDDCFCDQWRLLIRKEPPRGWFQPIFEIREFTLRRQSVEILVGMISNRCSLDQND
jgi:hypothetical protein